MMRTGAGVTIEESTPPRGRYAFLPQAYAFGVLDGLCTFFEKARGAGKNGASE